MIISLLLLCVVVFSVSATFAADEDATLSEVDEIAIDDDVLTIDETGDELSVTEEEIVQTDDTYDVVGEAKTVTNSTFFEYFDKDTGYLTSDADELIFEGDFTGLNASTIILAGDTPIKLSGNSVTLTNVQFLIMQDDVTIDGFNLVYNDGDGKLIYTMSEDVLEDITISNNNIDFTAIEGYDSYAIFAGADPIMGSNAVYGLNILNNVFTYVGNTNGSTINNVIRVLGYEGDDEEEIDPDSSYEILVKNNKFDIKMPSVPVTYNPDYSSVLNSAGLEFFFCDELEITNNTIDLVYTSQVGPYDTIKVIDIAGNPFNLDFFGEIVCGDILINNNTINAVGGSYIYAISVSGEGIEIYDNNITEIAEGYQASGICVEAPSTDAIVKNNNVKLDAKSVAYGIYSFESSYSGAINELTISNNNISVDSYASCGMELAGRKINVVSNNIESHGNNTFGIALNSINLVSTVSNNNIVCLGSNVGNEATGDPYIPANCSRGISISGDVIVKNNDIKSTDIGINAIIEGEIEIDNNNITVNANNGDVENYAIKATEIDKLTLTNNNITFTGKTNGVSVSNAVYVFDTEAIVSGNNFDLAIVAADIIYGPAPTYEETIISEGIVFDYADDLKLENNMITVKYGEIIGYYDTIRAIDITNSDNVTINKNEFVIVGNNYIYAIKLGGENFTVSDNNLSVSSNYYANGINIEGESSGVIANNNINTISSGTAYPIYVGMTSQDISVNVTDNTIYGESYYVVGVEVGGDVVEVENNTITVKGNHTIAIGANVNELKVVNNTIVSDASNEGNIPIWDSIGTDTTGIKVNKGNFTIENNDIKTTGDYAVNSADNNGNITNNQLISNAGAGDDAVIGLGDVNVSGNPATNNPFLKVIMFANDLTKVEGSSDKFVVKIVDENGRAVGNKTIKLIVDDTTVLSVISDFEGLATFDADFAVGEHFVKAMFNGDANYGSKSITNNIVITAKPVAPAAPTTDNVVKKATKITAKKKTFKAKTKTKKYTITLKSGKTAIKKVRVTLKVKGKTYKATTNAKGKATFKIKNLKKKGKYTATIKFAGNKNYKASSKKVKITVKK